MKSRLIALNRLNVLQTLKLERAQRLAEARKHFLVGPLNDRKTPSVKIARLEVHNLNNGSVTDQRLENDIDVLLESLDNMKPRAKALTLDLSPVTSIEGKSLGRLAGLNEKLKAAGVGLFITINPVLNEIFENYVAVNSCLERVNISLDESVSREKAKSFALQHMTN